MPPNGKQQRLSFLDVLSNVPNSVIDDILTRMPLRDAVRTSILSKKWRYKWCKLSHLKLDQTLWKTTEDLNSPTIGFHIVLSHLLALHPVPITKFNLDIPDLGTCLNIDHLIVFLSRNGIQHLVLKLPSNSRYQLPSSFFSSSGLTHLTLNGFVISPPPLFKGFDRLISLELTEVAVSSIFLESLISHCPLLEHLVLEHNGVSNHIEISAPKLRSFFFRGCIDILHLKNAPLLSDVSFEPTLFSVEAEHDLAKIFECIPALENFRWNHFYTEVLDVRPVEILSTRLLSAVNRLKRLDISWISLEEFLELSFALCLMRSCPNLEEIKLGVYVDPEEEYFELVPPNVVDEIPTSFADVTFNHLRTVKIYGVTGAEAEMQLIKVLLVKSPELVRMVIKPSYGMKAKRSLEVLAKITKFQRASSKAEVVYSAD